MVLRLILPIWIPVLWIPVMLTGCVDMASTSPACPDCGEASQTDSSASAQESESNASVENPIRSLDPPSQSNPSFDAADQGSAGNPALHPGARDETAPRGLSDAEVGELIEGVVVSSDELGDAGLVPGDNGHFTGLGFVDRWGFPILGELGPEFLLDLFIDGLSFGILPPDRGGAAAASDFTILERQCIAQGEPEFICRQRYGR